MVAQSSFIVSIAFQIWMLVASSRPSMKYSLGTHIVFHFRSWDSQIFLSISSLSPKLVASCISSQTIPLHKNSASATFCVKTPIVSKLLAIGMTPYLDTLPYVPLKPTTHESQAGCLTLPPVSVPRLAGTSFADTAAADPELLPPGTFVMSQGFLVVLNAEFSHVVPMANSSQLSRPRLVIQSFFSREVAVDS